MTIAISESDYIQLWQQDRQQIGSQGDRQSDTIDFCPPEFGRGFERWIKLPGIQLLIIDRQFDQNLTIEYSASEPESYAEFGFNILGNWHHQSSGTNFLDLIIDRSYAGGIYQVNQGERILKVDIHLQPSQLLSNFITDGFDLFPLELKQVIEGKNAEFYGNVCINTAAMKLALNQIVNCPFSGLIRQLYLESKCLELIALKLEQITKSELNSVKEIVLKSEDIDRIHRARDILIDRLSTICPIPSLPYPTLPNIAPKIQLRVVSSWQNT